MIIKTLLLTIGLLTLSLGYSQNSDVTIPNIFTPNNDGVNDFFEIKSNGFDALTCTIYNRHGGLVYRYFGLKGFWDGYTHSGEQCVDGVYFIILELTKQDGSKESFQGHVQLIW